MAMKYLLLVLLAIHTSPLLAQEIRISLDSSGDQPIDAEIGLLMAASVSTVPNAVLVSRDSADFIIVYNASEIVYNAAVIGYVASASALYPYGDPPNNLEHFVLSTLVIEQDKFSLATDLFDWSMGVWNNGLSDMHSVIRHGIP